MEITTDKTFSGLFRRDGRFVTKFVYDMLQKFDLNFKKRVIVVGIIHGIFLGYGIFEAIRKVIEEERPLTQGDIFYMVIHLLFHALLISTLIMGVVLENHLFLLPWLIVAFPVFATISYFILIYSHLSYISQFVFNIFCICVGWYLWFTVCQFYRNCRTTNKKIKLYNVLSIQ